MSRMSKYLKQTCTLEVVALDNELHPRMNVYGELVYAPPVTIKCKRRKYSVDVETSSGAIVKSENRYHTVEEIGINDKLDGKVVLSISEITNEQGLPEGYRSVT